MRSGSKVTGIILAAGEGSRMGRTKQLLPFRGKTLVECVVDSALASRLERLVVVLGHDAEAIEPLLNGREVTIVNNPDYRSGQSSSLRAGLQAVSGDAEAVLFLLGDQPLVTPALINRMIAAGEASDSPIILPARRGKRGNPVLFRRETFAAIAALDDDCGARSLFAAYASRLLMVAVDDPAIHFDVDTGDDYRRLLEEHADPGRPGQEHR